LKNCIIFFIGGVISFLILIKFSKEHAFIIWIQKKIDRFDNDFNKFSQEKDQFKKRQPLYSILNKHDNSKEEEYSIINLLIELKSKFIKDPYFDSIPFEEQLIKFPASKCFLWITFLLFLFFISAFLWCAKDVL